MKRRLLSTGPRFVLFTGRPELTPARASAIVDGLMAFLDMLKANDRARA